MTGRGRMLVTGAGGMVGSYVREVFGDYELILTDLENGWAPLDVRDPVAVRRTVDEYRPSVVLHLAAATDVDRCEQDPDWAFRTNAIGTQNVALACQAFEVPLIYISTAGVFRGDKREPYTEFDTPDPANVYGRAKLAGEQVVTALLRHYYIVRAGWMIGGGPRDKKFVGKLTQLITSGRVNLKVVNDKVGSPTFARDLLRGIRVLMGTGYYGLYHMVNEGCVSRFEVALAIRDLLNRPDLEIQPVSSAHFPLPAPRADSEAMRNLKLELLELHVMQPWRSALAEYVVNELLPGCVRSDDAFV